MLLGLELIKLESIMDSIFFVVSKVAWVLLSPGNLIVLGFLFGLLLLLINWKRLAITLLTLTSAFSLAILIYPVGDYLISPLEGKYSQPKVMPQDIDGIILLGGGEDLKRSISWQVAELGLGGDRYIATKKLSDLYPAAKIYFSGGSGSMRLQNTQKESHFAEVLFDDLNIDKDRAVFETNSRNTYENFKNLNDVLDKSGKYLLITSAFHMPRSVAIANKFELDVIPYPVDYRSNSADLRYFDIDLFDHLKALEPAVSEWVGLAAYYLTGKI